MPYAARRPTPAIQSPSTARPPNAIQQKAKKFFCRADPLARDLEAILRESDTISTERLLELLSEFCDRKLKMMLKPLSPKAYKEV